MGRIHHLQFQGDHFLVQTRFCHLMTVWCRILPTCLHIGLPLNLLRQRWDHLVHQNNGWKSQKLAFIVVYHTKIAYLFGHPITLRLCLRKEQSPSRYLQAQSTSEIQSNLLQFSNIMIEEHLQWLQGFLPKLLLMFTDSEKQHWIIQYREYKTSLLSYYGYNCDQLKKSSSILIQCQKTKVWVIELEFCYLDFCSGFWCLFEYRYWWIMVYVVLFPVLLYLWFL